MSISSSDLEYRYSNPSASAGDELGQDSPQSSLGGWLSRSVWYGTSPEDLFANMDGDQNGGQTADYRCLFAVNKHDSLTLQATKLWLASEVSGGATIAIGLDPLAASSLTATSPQAMVATSVNAPPVGVVFSAPTSKGAGLLLGDIGPGECRAFWIRRTGANTAALDNDGVDIRFEGDSN